MHSSYVIQKLRCIQKSKSLDHLECPNEFPVYLNEKKNKKTNQKPKTIIFLEQSIKAMLMTISFGWSIHLVVLKMS